MPEKLQNLIKPDLRKSVNPNQTPAY